MNVLLNSSASSLDFGIEDCDPHSFAAYHSHYSYQEELLEPTSFASMQPHQHGVGKRTRRASATAKDASSIDCDEDYQPAAVPSKRQANKKAPSKAGSSSSFAADASVASSAGEGYTKRDILSGRGGLANKHFGNKVFRRLIKHNKDLYRRLKSKVKQELLIKSILLAVQSQGGRFLKKDEATGTWYQIDEKEAWSKTCQALREPERSSRASDGEDGSEEGTLDGSMGGSVSSSSYHRKTKATAAPKPAPRSSPPTDKAQEFEEDSADALTPLARMARQYTTDDPPTADPQIFDHEMMEGPDQLPYNDDDAAAAAIPPPGLEMASSMFSLSGGFPPPIPGFAGMDRARRSFSYQQSELSMNSTEPLHGFQSYGSSYYQDYYHNHSQSLLHHGGQSGSMLPPPQLMRSDSASLQFGHPLGMGQGPQQHGLMMMSSAAASLSSSLPSGSGVPPPLPLLRSASSAAFYRSLEDMPGLDRQESTSSYDFSSFANNQNPTNSAPV